MSDSDQREEAVFEAALQLQGAERVAYLDQACARDPTMRERVAGLLGALGRAGGLLNEPAVPRDQVPPAAPIAPTAQPGDRIGRYKLLQQIGEGGCGVVYMAGQEEPVRRRVAFKILKLGLDTKQVIGRFEAERQALALMDHPNIARVFDAGATETGRPYFVMELVRGVKITEFCDQKNLSTRERLDLFILVCRAVQHAHQKGIIHRDLKPSNILVTSDDGVPVPKVIDFGIAKATQGRLSDHTVFTAFEQFIGTPAYMSPEQAEMSLHDIDTRTDIYSLGVLLYELLTGQTPFDQKELLAAGLDAMRRTIREVDPVKPSTRLTQVHLANLSPDSARSALRISHSAIADDLDWIAMKCLEKDRARRYETANGLAVDIARHLANEPIVARPPSAGYRFRKLVRRNRIAFAATGGVLAALLLGLAGILWQWRRAESNALVATSNLRESYLAQARSQRGSSKAGHRLEALEVISKAAKIKPSLDLRSEAIAHLAQADLRVAHVHSAAQFPDNETFDPSFSLAAVFSGRSGVEVQRAFSREVIARIRPARGDVTWLRKFSPDQRYLALATSEDGTCIWDLDRGAFVIRGLPEDFTGDFSPDSQTFAIGNQGGSISLFDLSTGQELRRLGQNVPGQGVAFDPSGARLACWNYQRLEILDSVAGERIRTLEIPDEPTSKTADDVKQLGSSRRVGWSTDGQLLAAGFDRRIYLWRVENGRLLQVYPENGAAVISVALSPGGEFMATSSFDETTRIWELLTGRMLASVPGSVYNLAFSRDGRYLGPGRLRTNNCVFELIRPTGFHRLAPAIAEFTSQKIHAMDFSPDGRLVAAAAWDGVRLWDRLNGQFLAKLPTGGACSALFDPDGSALFVSASGELSRWPLIYQQGQGTNTLAIGPAQNIGLSGGPWLFAALEARSGKLAVASAEQPAAILSLRAPTNWVRLEKVHPQGSYIALSPDGRFVATGSTLGSGVWVWDAQTGRLLHEHPAKGFAAVAFSPDGRWLMVGGEEYHALSVGDWTKRETVRPFTGEHVLGMMAFSPDGRLWARLKTPTSYELVEPGTWRSVAVLQSPFPFQLGWPRFSRDGTMLAAADTLLGVQIWDLRELRGALRPMGLDWDHPQYPANTPMANNRPIVARVLTQ